MMNNISIGVKNEGPQMSFNNEIDQHSEHRLAPTKDQFSNIVSAGVNVSGSRTASTPLRGWGNRPPRDIQRQDDVSRKRRNVNDNHNFFSRKSFNEMGCSNYLIESLRGLHFLRPSNIQVCQFF